jgi:hypothetical protein
MTLKRTIITMKSSLRCEAWASSMHRAGTRECRTLHCAPQFGHNVSWV